MLKKNDFMMEFTEANESKTLKIFKINICIVTATELQTETT